MMAYHVYLQQVVKIHMSRIRVKSFRTKEEDVPRTRVDVTSPICIGALVYSRRVREASVSIKFAIVNH